jgi:hypothetical protein
VDGAVNIGPASRGRNVSNSRDLSMPPSQLHQSHSATDQASPLPVFAPFSPPVLAASLAPSAGKLGADLHKDAAFISPSTLLSPQPHVHSLPADGAGAKGAPAAPAPGVDAMTHTFGQLGVNVDAAPKSKSGSPTGEQ